MKPLEPSQEKEQRLIRYVLKKALLTEVELQICLKFQKKLAASGRKVSLAKIILKKNYLSRSVLEQILYQFKTSPTDILLESKNTSKNTTTLLKKKPLPPDSATKTSSLKVQTTKVQKKNCAKIPSKVKSLPKNIESSQEANSSLRSKTTHSSSKKILRKSEKTSVIRRRTEKNLQDHLQENSPLEKKETLQLKKAAFFLFLFCLLLTVLVVIGILNKQRLKKQREHIQKQQIQLELTRNSSSPEEIKNTVKNDLLFTAETHLKEIETQYQEKKYWASWESLHHLLKKSPDILTEKKAKTLLIQTELALLQQFFFGPHLQFSSEGQIQMAYDFSEQDYPKDFIQKNCFYQAKSYYQIRQGSLYHIGRCRQFLQIKIMFQLQASQGKLSLYGLNYRLHYPVSGKGISLKLKGQKKPLWQGNGPKLTSGELFWSIETPKIKLIYQNQTILELLHKNIQSGGFVIQFQNEKGEEGLLLKRVWLNSTFDEEWMQKILQDLAQENLPH